MPLKPCDTKRLLVVDDEEMIRRLFKTVISTSFPAIQVDTAGDGGQAAEAFSRAHHAVIVLDVHMPGKDGVWTFNEIKRICGEREWAEPAVIFCTGYAPPDTIRNLVSDDKTHRLLLKPVRTDTLVRTIKECI